MYPNSKLRFVVDPKDGPRVITAKVEVDEDCDLLLTVNGVKVLFIDCLDGSLYTLVVADKEARESTGLAFESVNNTIRVGS